jgi:hypothetical protein
MAGTSSVSAALHFDVPRVRRRMVGARTRAVNTCFPDRPSIQWLAAGEGIRMRTRTLAGLLGIALLAAACSTGSVFELAVGDCFDDVSGDGGVATEVSDVPVVDCSEPHDNEVYAVFEMDDLIYPGVLGVQDAADEGCLGRFSPYVGIDYYESSLDYIYLAPSAESWEEGDREVICALYAMDLSKLTGSMRNSGE